MIDIDTFLARAATSKRDYWRARRAQLATEGRCIECPTKRWRNRVRCYEHCMENARRTRRLVKQKQQAVRS